MPPHDAPRVGYVVKAFPRLSETFILNEILELERRGSRLQLFSLKRPTDRLVHGQVGQVRAGLIYLPERAQGHWARLLRAHLHALRHYPHGYWRTLHKALRRHRDRAKGLVRFSQACCLISESGPLDHLHAHFATEPCEVAFLAHCLTGISYSVTTHAKDLYQGDRLGCHRLREQMGRAHFVVGNSRYSAGDLAKSFSNGRASPGVYTVYNGIDLEAFPRRRAEPGEPLILSVGRLVAKKGFPDLLEACRLLKQRGVRFRCQIAGGGVLEADLRRLVKDLGLAGEMALLGPLPQQALRGRYERAAVFALPCVVAEDGDRDLLPNVLKEAMAVGVPVVTTRLGGIEELVEDGTSGLLVPPGDPRALSAALERLLADPHLRQRLAGRARRVVEERFDRCASFARLKQLLDEALGQRRAPARAGTPPEHPDQEHPNQRKSREPLQSA